MEGHPGVLVLNRLYQAVQVTGVRRAFRLFYTGRARAITSDFSSFDFADWCDLPPSMGAPLIRTPTYIIEIPSVIQLLEYAKVPNQGIRFNRRNLFIRDRSRCQYCGVYRSQRELNLDHVVPTSRGGRSTWENVVVACLPCNTRKGNRTPAEAHMKLIRPPKRPIAHPLLRSRWIGHRLPDSWKTFLDEAYWSVELSDEVQTR